MHVGLADGLKHRLFLSAVINFRSTGDGNLQAGKTRHRANERVLYQSLDTKVNR